MLLFETANSAQGALVLAVKVYTTLRGTRRDKDVDEGVSQTRAQSPNLVALGLVKFPTLAT